VRPRAPALASFGVMGRAGDSRGHARCDRAEAGTISRARLLAGIIAPVLLLALAAFPAGAGASVSIGAERIVVQAPQAGAVITRRPFQISFVDGGGRTVVSELAAPAAEPLTLPTPVAGVATPPPSVPALYAPLSYLVGTDKPTAYPNYTFSGDLESVEEAGTEYSAREVLAAEPSGDGVVLSVSTDDPSGRTLSVTVSPQGEAAIRVSATPSDPSGVAAMADSFGAGAAEAFRGFGGRHNALDQRGQDFYNWVNQENVRSGSPGEGPGEANLEPDGPQAAYYVQSSFVSSAGYGFLLDNSAISRWRMASDRSDAWQTQVAAPRISYVVAPGDVPHAISTMTAITGRQRVPPSWAIGPMMDREVEHGGGAAHYELQVQRDLAKIAANHLPVSAYRIEGYGWIKRSALEADIATLHERGIHTLLYLRPFTGRENIGTEDPQNFTTALERGYLARTAGGEPYVFTDNFGQPAGVIDFTNPAAVSWWHERVDAELEAGADGFMLDFGEQVQPGMRFSDGSTGEEMHNRYPVLVQRVTREAVEEFEAHHPGRSIVFFTRSGYSGTPGSAAYENFNFPGDETTDWSVASGLASLAPDMLNRAIGGAYGYGTDIGGYWDVGVKPTTSELLLRWAAWSALSPVFRLHGAALGEEHTPWSYPSPAPIITAYRQLSKLHVAAQPLISKLWQQAWETGMPITRPLYLEYPNDPEAANQNEEWLLGPDVLVAPIVQQGAQSRSVYFPSGCWRSPASAQQVIGPQSVAVSAPLGQLPFFFRCGTEPFAPPPPFAAGLRH